MDEKILISYKEADIKTDTNEVLNNVDFELKQGEFAYLIGRVGSGKSSFLKTMYGELKLAKGDAQVLGYELSKLRKKDLPMLRRRIGIVFQDFQLLTDRTVSENLRFVLKATGWRNKADVEKRIEEVLAQVGMSDKGDKHPNELSGGEQQRVVIARAILNKPEVILADEPTGNLDMETGRKIVELLREICNQGSAIIMITHNLQYLHEYPGKVYRCEAQRLMRTSEF